VIRSRALVLLCALLAGCAVDRAGLRTSPPGGDDLGTRDLGTVDLGVRDLGGVDQGSNDLGLLDLGLTDLGVSDLGRPDLGSLDLGPLDLGPLDSGPPDLGPPDLGPRDLGVDAGPCASGPDSDGDGIVDACDDWPCGVRPTISATVAGQGIQISAADLGGGGNAVVVAASSTVALTFSYTIDDTTCPSCLDQIEIGLVPGNRLYCAYDANPPGSGASGPSSWSVAAPPAPGRYDLRFNLGQNYTCTSGGATGWWGGAPDASRTFAALCVRP
jgi:hypothetical protein